MKSYLLLRDNQQSGPYTLEDFKKYGLHPHDLIWIEGESTCWNFPEEIQELTAFIKKSEKKIRQKTAPAATSQTVVKSSTAGSTLPEPSRIGSTHPVQPTFEAEAKDVFADFRLQSTIKRRYTLGANLVALLVLAIGVAMTAYVVRSIVLSFGNEPVQSAQATEIQSISYEAEHAAYSDAQPPLQPAVYRESALTPVEETVAVIDDKPIETSIAETKPEVRQPATDPEVKAKSEEKKVEPVMEQKGVKEDVEVKKEEPKEEKPVKDVKNSDVKVSGNHYKVGLLGGISDLALQVINSSSHTVDKAVVEVSYLKKNGSVVHTETVQVKNIKPGGSKTVQVPASSRGVKVDYRVVNVESADSK